MPIGPGKSTAGLGGNYPQVNREGHTKLRQKMLFYSDRGVALIVPKTIKGGFGNLELGTPLAVMYDGSNAAQDKLVPYAAAADWADLTPSTDPARVMLLANADATASKFYIDVTKVGRFDEDDVVVLAEDDGPTYEEVTITSIDDEYNDVMAEITISGELSNAFATANNACVYHKGDTNDGGNTHLSKAVGILDEDCATGDADNPTGAHASMFVSNGILVNTTLKNMDSQALTDLGATEDGMYTIFK
jgi:hypothetical protein